MASGAISVTCFLSYNRIIKDTRLELVSAKKCNLVEPIGNRNFAEQRRMPCGPLPSLPPEDEEEERDAEGSSEDSLEDEDNNEEQISRTESPVSERDDDNEAKSR